jgi:hypothetical protein
MALMRAKLRVSGVQKYEDGNERLSFQGVAKSDGYPADGVDEDNTFARWSPSVDLSIYVANPALHGLFTVGDKFYLDFTRAS